MALTESLRREVDDIWSAILHHPFVVELYEGILPIDKFRFYLEQDYNFLLAMGKCFALIAAKSDHEVSRIALEIAYADSTTEMSNYIKLLELTGLDINQVIRAEPSPVNLGYTSFLLATCALGDPIEGLIATLPCFWSYMEIAEYHRDRLSRNKVDVYKRWASVYLSSEYRSIVNTLRRLIDENSSRVNYERALSIFKTASRYEYLFWDMAYKVEKWPV